MSFIHNARGPTKKLKVGSRIRYVLLPRDLPTDRDREWHGEVTDVYLNVRNGLPCVKVRLLDQGYERFHELVMLEQITAIEEEKS